jgi:cytosine/adenosine deaminase-related metal-dependent hydrolase
VIRNGAIATANGRIVAVGTFAALQAQFSEATIVNCPGVLMPGLVNAHIHLELSVYRHIPRPSPEHSFCDWIRSLLQARQESQMDDDEVARAARQTRDEQYASGVLLFLDTGNILPASSSSFPDSTHDSYQLPSVSFLFEMLGPDVRAEQQALSRLAALPDAVAATPHALYSTTPAIIRAIRERAARLGHIVSLHVAESADELELLRNNGGCFRAFLEERGSWDGSLSSMIKDNRGAVDYLEQLGLLDEGLLCVHCVQVCEREIRLLAERGCRVCLCPGSNRFLNVGRAPVELMLKHGLLPALGTDSFASNEQLDLWREMRILHEDHPGITSATILKMATLGGAQALGRDQDYGSLAAGRKASFINVNSSALQEAQNEERLLDVLAREGRPESIHWMSADENTAI